MIRFIVFPLFFLKLPNLNKKKLFDWGLDEYFTIKVFSGHGELPTNFKASR
jgi:hypothetical protein